jgi:hypothetical protein
MKVFANGREISCKAGSGKSIAAFPDVCLSPPTPPAGPIPIPYPVTATDADTDQGSKEVKIGGDPVMLKDESNFKTCTGDEAATKSQGMGVITASITGKVFFKSWSMDVKIEGQNAVRHLDLMTHNHASDPGQTPTWPYMQSMGSGGDGNACQAEQEKTEKACEGDKAKCPEVPKKPENPFDAELKTVASDKRPAELRELLKKDGNKEKYKEWQDKREQHFQDMAKQNQKDECQNARRCQLVPYKKGCCPGQTPHHLVEASAFHDSGRGPEDGSWPVFGCEKYKENDAPCICLEGPDQNTGTHGMMHTIQSAVALKSPPGALFSSQGIGTPIRDRNGKAPRVTNLDRAQKSASRIVNIVFPESGCSSACIEAQLSDYHERQCGMGKQQPIKAVKTADDPDVKGVVAQIKLRKQEVIKKVATPGLLGGD